MNGNPIDLGNARLIAAAPDLLVALIKCANTFNAYAYHHRFCGVANPEKEAANLELARMCEMAIAKATGETA